MAANPHSHRKKKFLTAETTQTDATCLRSQSDFTVIEMQNAHKRPTVDKLQLRNPLRGSSLKQLLRNLNHKESDIRAQAAEAIGECTGIASLAAPSLVRALRDSSPRVRYFASQSLGNIDSPPKTTIPELLLLIDQSEELNTNSVGFAAYRAVVKIGMRKPEEVLPILLSELSSDNETLRSRIKNLLFSISSTEKNSILRYLDRAVRSDNETISHQALELIEKIKTI
jgi:HEAT repeat protein